MSLLTTGLDRPRQPATLATGFRFLFQSQTRSSVCGLNMKKETNKTKKKHVSRTPVSARSLNSAARAPKRSGGLKGQPRNTGTCSDLQGQPCRGFKWPPAAAVCSATATPGLLEGQQASSGSPDPCSMSTRVGRVRTILTCRRLKLRSLHSATYRRPGNVGLCGLVYAGHLHHASLKRMICPTQMSLLKHEENRGMSFLT